MPSPYQNRTCQPVRLHSVLMQTLLLLTACSSFRPAAGQAGRPTNNTNRCKDRTTFRVSASDLAAQPLTFQCPQGPILAVKDVGVKGRCKGSSPDLRMLGERCTWNSTCTVKDVGRAMDTVVAGSDRSCQWQTPDHFEISYMCLKNNVDVYDVMGRFNRTQKQWGIARSHPLFPWTYRNGNQLGNLTIDRPRSPDFIHLWFTVHHMGILDSDLVLLSWDDNSNRQQKVDALRLIYPNDTTFHLSNVRSVNLTFYADYSVHHSQLSGKENGFVVCFQWLKMNRRPNKNSTCTKVMQPGRCQERRGRGSSSGQTTPSRGRTTPPRGQTTPPRGQTTPSRGRTTPPRGRTTPPIVRTTTRRSRGR